MTMAIDFQSTFGNNRRGTNNQRQAGANTNELPKAQFWLNVGYIVSEGTDEQRFVSLPYGIPLDTMERLSTRSSNQDFAMFQAARNDLLEQILAAAKDLEPGQEVIIDTMDDNGQKGSMSIQIRRVNAEQAAPKTDESNPFVRRLFAA